MVIDLLVTLAAGQHNFLGIDHDDIVAIVDMRREGGLVLAAQPMRDDRRQPTQDETLRIDYNPFLLDIRRFGRSCLAEHDGVRVNADGAGKSGAPARSGFIGKPMRHVNRNHSQHGANRQDTGLSEKRYYNTTTTFGVWQENWRMSRMIAQGRTRLWRAPRRLVPRQPIIGIEDLDLVRQVRPPFPEHQVHHVRSSVIGEAGDENSGSPSPISLSAIVHDAGVRPSERS